MLEIILQFRVILNNNNSFFSHIEASSIVRDETSEKNKINIEICTTYNIRTECGSYATNIADIS